jgi:hypothetical protein
LPNILKFNQKYFWGIIYLLVFLFFLFHVNSTNFTNVLENLPHFQYHKIEEKNLGPTYIGM